MLLVIAACTLISACKSTRFNWYDRLAVKPTEAELVGSYRLLKADPDAAPLLEMGYTAIDCGVDLRQDRTFSAFRLPGCCLHGWDERMYPFTGGLYSMSGKWAIVKTEAVFEIELTIETITEHTGLTIANPERASERQPPSSRKVSLIQGSPIDLGFEVFNGDFWPVRLARVTAAKKYETTK
ncbi:MAG: hypothetical protein ABI162_07955 [Luteolibacter sp.]